MNKRIQNLVLKASKLADIATDALNDDSGNWQEIWNEVYDQEFAELIIKECAKIADDGFGSAHFGLGISGKMLKDHFGIKD